MSDDDSAPFRGSCPTQKFPGTTHGSKGSVVPDLEARVGILQTVHCCRQRSRCGEMFSGMCVDVEVMVVA